MDPVPDCVVWGRSFAACLAVAHGADQGSVADLRIAASEIIAHIVAAGGADSVVVEARPERGRLVFVFSPWQPDDDDDLAPYSFDPWDVVSVLFEGAIAADGSASVPVAVGAVS
jgi:hypothetical protein